MCVHVRVTFLQALPPDVRADGRAGGRACRQAGGRAQSRACMQAHSCSHALRSRTRSSAARRRSVLTARTLASPVTTPVAPSAPPSSGSRHRASPFNRQPIVAKVPAALPAPRITLTPTKAWERIHAHSCIIPVHSCRAEPPDMRACALLLRALSHRHHHDAHGET